MRWIILIGNENFDLNTIKAVEHYESIDSYDVTEIKGRYCVDFGDDHIFYDFRDIIEDYEKDELNQIPYDNPSFIMMIYTSKNRIRAVLKQDNFPDNIYVDNDFGLIVSIKKFIKLGMPLDEDDMEQSMKLIELEKLKECSNEIDLIDDAKNEKNELFS